MRLIQTGRTAQRERVAVCVRGWQISSTRPLAVRLLSTMPLKTPTVPVVALWQALGNMGGC